MAISFEKFLNWAEDRFPGEVIAGANEIKINSIFSEEPDYKHHLWCNPYGGKKGEERPHGVFHCWKTGRKGTLVSLVMKVDHCPPEEAIETLEGSQSIWELSDEVDRLFENPPEVIPEPLPILGIALPNETYKISLLPENDSYRCACEVYLIRRCLPIGNKFICKAGDYAERIIIPYYDRKQRLIYFNGRYIGSDKNALRYMGPDKEIGVGKGDVIYMTSWPEQGSQIYLTEGELCADSLELAGFYSGAFGGKSLSDAQAEYLQGYLPCLCLDNDNAGKTALRDIAESLIFRGFNRFKYVRPPTIYKDWNQMLEKVGPKILRAYILSHEKWYDAWTDVERGTESI